MVLRRHHRARAQSGERPAAGLSGQARRGAHPGGCAAASMTEAQVGPILQTGELTDVLLSVLRQLTPGLQTVDRGSYVRVTAPGECHLTRAAVEERLGAPFILPGDLERVMTSFQGRFFVDEDQARWTAPSTSSGQAG